MNWGKCLRTPGTSQIGCLFYTKNEDRRNKPKHIMYS
jgi:hypothetical protein